MNIIKNSFLIKVTARLSLKIMLSEIDQVIKSLVTYFPINQKNYIECKRTKKSYILTISKNKNQNITDHVYNLDGTIL